MSKYTTEVRFICEHYSGLKESVEYESVASVIEKARTKVFDFDFPIYDESYRSVLETKILKHYYTREIGFETVALWKLWLDKRLNEIMPYYNQLYKSTTLEFNPFYDVDLTTDSKRNVNHDEDTTSKGNSKDVRTDNLRTESDSTSVRTDDLAHSDTTNTSSDTMTAYSDTPQGSLTGVQNLNYLTNATRVTGTGTETNNGTNTGTSTTKNNGTVSDTGTQTTEGEASTSGTRDYTNIDDYLEHVKGKRGGQSYAELLLQYRKTFLNIDMQIIDELSDLFMNLW